MKRWAVLVALAVCCVAGATSAQVDPEPDGIGIYTDLTATSNVLIAPPQTPVEIYVLLTRPSHRDGIAGWECAIDVPPNAVVWAWNLPSEALGFLWPPDFQVAPWPPLPATDIVHLMTFVVYLTDANPAPFHITYSERFNSGQFGKPVYVDNKDLKKILPLHTWPANSTQPAFVFNPRPTADDETSWGDVKRLYD